MFYKYCFTNIENPLLTTPRPHTIEDSRIKDTERLIADSWQLWDRFRQDPHRPTYHFVPPAAWMNDINGAIWWKGRYHIFYQHNPEGGYWKWIQWGHASSTDLLHWVHHPIALTPDLDGPDRDGCFSGGAFVSKEGAPMFIYHGVPNGTCLATSDDDLLLNWRKHPGNPVIPSVYEGEAGYDQYHVFDPCAWVQDGLYHALIGNRVPGVEGDSTALFKSTDLVNWEFAGPFYQSDRRWTHEQEDCAVPDFFPIGGKHMLLFCSHLQGTQYYLGSLENDRFSPDTHGWMGWPGGQMGGPRSLQDTQGRRIFFDWVREMRGRERERASGWSGVMTVPRILTLATDGTLAVDLSRSSLDSSVIYPYYRAASRQVPLLPEHEHTVQAQVAPFQLHEGERLELRLFLDRSILEVFANGRQCITQRIYPTRSDSTQVSLGTEHGGVTIRSLEAWDMAPTQV